MTLKEHPPSGITSGNDGATHILTDDITLDEPHSIDEYGCVPSTSVDVPQSEPHRYKLLANLFRRNGNDSKAEEYDEKYVHECATVVPDDTGDSTEDDEGTTPFASFTPENAWYITGEKRRLTACEYPALFRQPGLLFWGEGSASAGDQPELLQPEVSTMASPEEIKRLVSEWWKWTNTRDAWQKKGRSIKFAVRQVNQLERRLREYAPDELQSIRERRAQWRMLDGAVLQAA